MNQGKFDVGCCPSCSLVCKPCVSILLSLLSRVFESTMACRSTGGLQQAGISCCCL
jgi:hypothetical protein